MVRIVLYAVGESCHIAGAGAKQIPAGRMKMAGRLKGKTVLVTAAGQGMGRAAAIAMAREGAKVFATDINKDALAEVKGQARGIKTYLLDVTKPKQVAKIIEKTGPVDVLFNCSGYVHHGTIMDCDDAAWDFSFELNVRAQYRMAKAVIPGMLERGGGSIINMASVVSSIKGAPARFVYGATKAAVIGMTRSIAIDFIKQNIRCNAICPGTIDTPSLRQRVEKLGEQMGGYDKAREWFLSRQPTGKLADADDVAPLIVWLASDESSFVTGQNHIIDGGWSI
jgi:2-keto-3-deoxy-L-fuconate dehydrogenase